MTDIAIKHDDEGGVSATIGDVTARVNYNIVHDAYAVVVTRRLSNGSVQILTPVANEDVPWRVGHTVLRALSAALDAFLNSEPDES